MNAAIRRELEKLSEEINAIMDRITEIREEEEEKYDNLPESLQESEKGEAFQEGIDSLENAEGNLDSAMSDIAEVIR